MSTSHIAGGVTRDELIDILRLRIKACRANRETFGSIVRVILGPGACPADSVDTVRLVMRAECERAVESALSAVLALVQGPTPCKGATVQ